MVVAEDLDLDVAGRQHAPLEQHAVVTEGRLGLAAAGMQGVEEVARRLHHPHALAATAGRGLDHQREADAFRLPQPGVVVRQVTVEAGHHRHTGLLGDVAGRALATELLHHLGGRPDEGQPGRLDGADEVGVLAEEPVAGMHRVAAVASRHVEHLGDVEIALGGAHPADRHGEVGGMPVRGIGVGIAVQRHRFDPALRERCG